MHYEGVPPPPPREPYRPLRAKVRAGCEDRATQPPPCNVTGGNDPCSSGNLRSEVHTTLGSRPTCHAATLPHGAGAIRTVQPVQYSGHSVSPARDGSVDLSQLVASFGGAPRPLGVAGLAMRRLSLAALVCFSCFGGVIGGNSRGALSAVRAQCNYLGVWPY